MWRKQLGEGGREKKKKKRGRGEVGGREMRGRERELYQMWYKSRGNIWGLRKKIP